MVTAAVIDVERARQLAESVADPELPMVTLADLGIVREVAADGDRVVVTITPTYSGCPAMTEIARDIRSALVDAGFGEPQVRTRLAPAWTTDWITADGRRKLAEARIAPPGPAPSASGPVPLTLSVRRRDVSCPLCGSADTEQTSAFSSTACKALYRCRVCREPFEYFKEI